MSTVFCLTVRFLDPVPSFHGRGDGEEPEWPPSPLRLFQALVAASAARWRGSQFADHAEPALKWIESRTPVIVAPDIQANRTLYRMYVPNNAADLVTAAWARGNTDASIAGLRVEKDVRPTRLIGGDGVHFLWDLPVPVPAEVAGYLETLVAAARSITHLGWGVDMVAANANVVSADEAAKLDGHVWRPMLAGGTRLRTPISGTFAALVHRHGRFLVRLSTEAFQPVPPLSAFTTIGYHSPTVLSAPPVARPFAAFQLLTPDADRKWSRDACQTIEVAGMLRHATRLAAEAVDRPAAWIDSFVLGHGSGKNQQAVGEEGVQRFSYVPLPTIRPPQGVVGPINRVLVVEPPDGTGADAAWARRMLSGRELIEDKSKSPAALLSVAPASDWVVRQYTADREGSAVWSTVTPVVLPGYDDPDHLRRRLRDVKSSEAKKRLYERLDARIESLLRKALVQAGFSSPLADNAALEWRLVGFRPGLDLATRYAWPRQLKGKPRYHVRIHWRDAAGGPVKVRGPVVIGAGRYCGLGLFVRDD